MRKESLRTVRWALPAAVLVGAAVLPQLAAAQVPVVVRARSVGPGWLGLSVEEVIGRDRNGPFTGITVTGVVPDGPSARAGLEPGDRIVRVAGDAATPGLFNRVASGLEPGDRMSLTVEGTSGARRSLVVVAGEGPASARIYLSPELAARVESKVQHMDSLLRVTVTTGRAGRGSLELGRAQRGGNMVVSGGRMVAAPDEARPLLPHIEGQDRVGGARLTVLNEDLASYFDVDGGLLVTEVIDGTPMSDAGVRPGDVIVRVDGGEVGEIGAVRRALWRAEPDEVVLSLVRKGERLDVRLEREEP